MLRHFILLSFTFFCVVNLQSQTRIIDSLKAETINAVKDSNLVNTLIELSIQTRSVDAYEASTLIDQAIDVAIDVDFERGLMVAYYHKGVAEYYLGNFDSIESPLQKSLEIGKRRNDPKVLFYVNNVLGVTYNKIGRDLDAIVALYSSATTALELGDSLNYAIALANIGEIHLGRKDNEQARAFFEQSIPIIEAIGEPPQIGGVYVNLAATASNQEQKMYYSRLALTLGRSAEIIDVQVYALNSIGVSLLDYQDSLSIATKYLQEGYDLANDLGEKFTIAVSNLNLGRAYSLSNQRRRAEQLLNTGLTYAIENNFVEEQEQAYLFLSEHHEKYGNMHAALDNYKLHRQLSDSLYNSNFSKQITEANVKFETEQKEAEILRQQFQIDRQESERFIILLSSVLGIGVLGSVFFGFYQRTKRKRHQSEIILSQERQRIVDLEKISQVKTDFFNNVSHELRTPLTMIMAPISEAMKNVRNVNIKKDLALAHRNSQKLIGMINEILDLSKLESGKLQYEQSTLYVQTFLKRVLSAFESLARSQEISLDAQINIEKNIVIDTDVHKLEMILNNLISNAIKYTKSRTMVTLIATVNQNDLIISVVDEGEGIAADELPHVFERFYQTTTTAHSSGTGIGLSIAKEFCEFIGGSITAKSKQDIGSEFTIVLPDVYTHDITVMEESDPPISTTPVIDAPLSDNKQNILIVEDDLEMSKFLLSLLEQKYGCTTVFNGRQALDQLKKHPYDLITCDVMMPEMDGFQLRDKINLYGKWKDIPFIMLTARALEEDRLRGLRLGVDDYITKPFSTEELIARIDNLLQNSSKRKSAEPIDSQDSYPDELINKVVNIVHSHMDDKELNVSFLATQLAMSNRQLQRTLRKLTGMSPVELILEIRMKRAFDLIRDRKYSTISQVSYLVGIESLSYFSKKFKERFGINPGEIL